MAQAKKIGVTLADMRNASQKMSQYSDQYTTLYKQMYSAVDAMNGATWAGVDSQAFTNQIYGFIEELQAMAKSLEVASQALEKQRKQYEERQNHITSQVKNLRN